MDVQSQIAYIVDEFEGGNDEKLRPYASYSDDPDDHGDATRWGISRGTLSAFLGLPAGELCPTDRVRELTRDDAIRVGTEMVALRPGLYRIRDARLRFVVLDYAFNSGDPQAVLDLQRVLGFAQPTSHFGPRTEASVNAIVDVDACCEQFVARRLEFIGKDLAQHHDQAKWAHGWLVRVGKVLCYRVP